MILLSHPENRGHKLGTEQIYGTLITNEAIREYLQIFKAKTNYLFLAGILYKMLYKGGHGPTR